MDYLSDHFNGFIDSEYHKEPDLKCSSYLAYPEFEESVCEDSEIQLKLCIMELYEYVHNGCGSLKDGEERRGFQKGELLSIISEISSIISVCMETKVDHKDSADVHCSQVQRLREQRRNIDRLREVVDGHEVLSDLVWKISHSIQSQLFCLSRIVNTVELSSPRQDDYYELDSGLTPLRIKYPYMTGTYTQLNNGGAEYRQAAIKYPRNKTTISNISPGVANGIMGIMQGSPLAGKCGEEYFIEEGEEQGYQSIEEAERDARLKLRNRKKANCQIDLKERGGEEYHMVKDAHSKSRVEGGGREHLSASESLNKEELEPAILEKFTGGITRLIVERGKARRSGGRPPPLLEIDGWGLIEHHREERPATPRDGIRGGGNSTLDSSSDEECTSDPHTHARLVFSDSRTSRGCRVSRHSEKSTERRDCSCSNDDFDAASNGSVRTLKNRFEKDHRKVGPEFKKDCSHSKSTTTHGDKMTSTESNRRGRFKLECSSSSMPTQQTNTTSRPLSNYRDTMYSTSSWLPLTRNTGFNYECLNSNSDKNSCKPSGSEYNPAAEYARFSDAVGKVVHPIIADESYRDNGKNIMNPKKLFNAKFGTLTEDTFKEIQEKLRLKMEGWTIHGSGLQDPRANLFWDPAVMTAASTVSPFYTNMPSSNSPLLTNTLIPPSSNGVNKRSALLESIGLSRLSANKEFNKQPKSELILDPPELTQTPPLTSMQNSCVSSPASSKQFPIKSMRELARRRKK